MAKRQQDGAAPPPSVQVAGDIDRIAWTALNALPARLCVLDENGQVIAANQAWHKFDLNPRCEGGQAQTQCLHCPAVAWEVAGLPSEIVKGFGPAIQDLLAGQKDSLLLEYECRTDGSSRWFEAFLTRLPEHEPPRLVMTHTEITERKHTEAALKQSAQRLKQLGAHLETVREEQSALIARELHDELGAVLTMLKLDLALTAENMADTPAIQAKFCELQEQVQSALRVVKRISTNLRPAMLDTLGLMATIRWYVEQFSRATGIATELQLPEYVRLSDLSNIAVFRIIQEGLTNIAAHAAASQASVQVRKEAGSLIVAISDNGQGIPADAQHKADSFGLIGMQERAHYLGGNLAVHSQPGQGTTLTLQIPLDSQSTPLGKSAHPRRRAQDWLQ